MKIITLTFLITLFALSIYGQDRTEHIDYGQGKSVGFALLGDGIVSAAFKFVKNQNQIEANIGFTSRTDVIVTGGSTTNFGDSHAGISLTGGYNFFLGSKNKERKHKVIKNYLSLKGGGSRTDVSELKAGITWHREAFRDEENNYSRGFDLGVLYSNVLDGDLILRGNELVSSYGQLFIRFDWNWFRP